MAYVLRVEIIYHQQMSNDIAMCYVVNSLLAVTFNGCVPSEAHDVLFYPSLLFDEQ